jgi:hypothetical protein
MTARRATAILSRAAPTATATVSPAAIVCASADLFRVPGWSNATVSIRHQKVPLFQPIELGVQLRDNFLGLIRDDDKFNIDLFYIASEYLQPPMYACPTPKHSGSRITGYSECMVRRFVASEK